MSKILSKEEYEDWKRQESTQSVFCALTKVRQKIRNQWEDELENDRGLSLEETAVRSRLMAAIARAYRDVVNLEHDEYIACLEADNE